MLDFSCPQCGRQFQVGDEYAGRHVRCSSCGHAFHAPTAETDAAAAASAPPTQPGAADAGASGAASQSYTGGAPANPYAAPPPVSSYQSGYRGGASYPPNSTYADSDPDAKPGAVTFYQVYCGLMLAMWLIWLAGGILLVILGANEPRKRDAEPMMIFGSALAVMGFLLSITYVVSFFLKRSKGAWIYGIVMIALGFLGGLYCLPLAIPLLVFWLQEPAKRYYKVIETPPMPRW